jgi:hypothetical protein
MHLVNLDSTTRKYMLSEVDMDVANGRLYYSKRFTSKGLRDYESLLREAVIHHDAVWLGEQLIKEARMSGLETSRSGRGKIYTKRTPFSGHETFAFGEYNRFYIRGLCVRAINEGIDQLVVYRAFHVAVPRASSEVKIGSHIDPKVLLEDLRENIGKNTRSGIPGGPNSGISVRFP